MPRAILMTRFVIGGTLPNGEIFQTGFWFGPEQYDDEPALQAVCNIVRDQFAGAASAVMQPLIPPTAAYRFVRAYYYEQPSGPADLQVEAPMNLLGTGAPGNHLPLQVAIVTTLETGLSGRRRRGRMFWPMLTADLTNHQLTQAQITPIATAVRDFFNGVNNGIPGLGTVVVHSQVTGATAKVTSVTLDSEPDITRRRANRQTELFQAGAAVA